MNKIRQRKIGVVTGSRAEYGYLLPLLRRLKNDQRINLRLYVCGMHLGKNYGDTIKEIIKDGFKITKKIDMRIKAKNSPRDIAASVAKGIGGFAGVFEIDKPDILVVFGDRIEPFAATAAATPLNIPIVHIGGGEVGLGDIDDNLRHAITKLAHIHIVSTQKSRERVLKLGEEKWRVFLAGALTLDTILQKKILSKKEIFKKYNITNNSLILVSYQPLTTEWERVGEQMKLLMSALFEMVPKIKDVGIVIIEPNNYPGRESIIKIIQNYQKKFNNIYVFQNIPHLDYVSLMASSLTFIGNSSSGIIEAPSLGIPFVSIGSRQAGREKGGNVIEAEYIKDAIKKAIKKSLFNKKFLRIVKKCRTPYGDGKAGARIANILSKIKINKELLQKKLTY